MTMSREEKAAAWTLACVWALVIFVAVFSFTGCATTPPDLVRSVDAVQVPVPVRERCVAEVDVPAVPSTHMRLGDAAQLAAGAAADVHDLVDYAAKANLLLRQCAALDSK